MLRIFALLAALVLASMPAAAQEEFPPQGKGRLVVAVSGASGPEHYRAVSRAIAKLGYDVVLFDGRTMENTHGAALKAAIAQAQQMPNALPGKVGLVGFSLGGGIALGYGSAWGDTVAADIVWYPATSGFHDIPGFAARIAAPVVMFAGEADTFHDCCLLETAHALEAAAKAANAPFTLTTYRGVEHDFVIDGMHYDTNAYAGALAKTAAALRQYMGN
jgi:dienelactone hydrolase